jgi:hypothetical protein
MKKLFLILISLLTISNLVQAQSVKISPVVGNVCKGRTFSVPFATNGTFETGNAYKVQIKPFNGTWTDLVSSESKNDILATVPETYGENDINSLYVIRVIASKPSVTSNEINLNGLFSKPNIELLQSVQNAVNPNGAVGIRISGKGSFPMNITLDDSTNITVNSLLINDGSFIVPEKSRDYFIVRVTNICGQGEAKGKLSVVLNEAAVKYFLTQNESYCLGGKLKLAYSSTKKFSNTTKVKIELRKFGSSVVSNEIDATESNGMIEAIIPDNVPVGEFHEVRVITNSPQSVSTWLNGIVVGERPSLELDNPPVAVDWNNTVPLKFNIKGIGPWNVTLSDGTSFVFGGIGYTNPNSQNSFTGNVKPDKTQKYSIASFSTGCGSGISSKSTVAVTVNPGIRIDSLKKGLSICLGQSFTAKYSTNGNLPSNSLSAVINTDKFNLPRNFLKVPAKFENGIVWIELPTNLFDGVNLFTGNFYVGIIYGDNKVTFSDYPITIKSLPTASLAKISPVTLQTKGNVFLPINLKGIAPITITMTDSTVFNVRGIDFTNYFSQSSNITTQIVQNTSFRLKSVSNDCGTVNINDTTTVVYTVRNIPANEITIQNNYYRVCAGEKIKVGFKTINPLSNTNEFRVELLFNNSLVSVVGRGKTSPIEIAIPDNIANVDDQYRIRVVSSESNLISPLVPVAIYLKQIVRINSGSAGSSFPKDFLPNETVSFFIAQEKFSTGLDNFTFSDGETTRQTSITKSFNASTTFSLVSVNNLCGEGTVRANSFKVNVVPYRIAIKVSSGIACKNKQLNIQYQTQGQTPVDLKYNLQIASTKDSVFRNLLENTNQNPLELAIPTTLQSGEYFIRLISNESNSQSSNWIKIAARDTPSVNITSNDNKNSIEFDRNKTTILKYNVANTFDGFFNAFVKGLDVNGKTTWIQNFSGNQTSEVYPRNTTTYSLLSAENTCGYGTVTGDVKVSMKPSLILINNFPISSICTDREVSFNYNSIGEFDRSNVFKFTLVSLQGKRYEVGQTNVGTGSIKVRIPTSVPASAYKVEISSINPVIVDSSTAYLSIATVPDIVLSSSTITNVGVSTLLSIFNNAGGRNQYLLSDSTRGEIIYARFFLGVKPSKTTTYKILSISNECGIGKSSGSATVTVNPLSQKNVETDFGEQFRFAEQYPYICTGATYTVNYKTTGEFSATNKFTVQMSDENGENFKDIVTEETTTPLRLKFTTPDDLKPSNDYRIRVVASDKDVSSAANLFPLIRSGKGPTAMFEASNYLFTEGKPIDIKINLTGQSPWRLRFGNEETSAKEYGGITTSPFVINLTSSKPDTYKIFEVSNGCPGKVIGSNTVKLELITANEEFPDLEVKLFPNPTSDKITIQSDNFKNTSLQIFDNLGRQVLQQNVIKSETVLDISNFKTGQYLLQIEREGKRSIYKIMKL